MMNRPVRDVPQLAACRSRDIEHIIVMPIIERSVAMRNDVVPVADQNTRSIQGSAMSWITENGVQF